MYAVMVETVAANLVAGIRDCSQQVGESFSHPSKHEEGCGSIVAVKKAEDSIHIPFDTGFKGFPRARRNPFGKGFHLEMFFHIDA
jgi:hypothetical protein